MPVRKLTVMLLLAASLMLAYAAFNIYVIPSIALKKVKALAANRGFTMSATQWKATGFNKIEFDSLRIASQTEDMIMTIHHGALEFSLVRYLTGQMPVVNLSVDSLSWVASLHAGSPPTENEKKNKQDYAHGWAERIFKAEKKIRNLLPVKILIEHTAILLKNNNTERRWQIHQLKSDKSGLSASLQTSEKNIIKLYATTEKHHSRYDISAIMDQEEFIKATADSQPFIFSFRTLSASLIKERWSGKFISASCHLKSEGLKFYHWRISGDTVKINRFETVHHFTMTDNKLMTDSTSYLLFNNIRFNSEIAIEKKSGTVVSFRGGIPTMPANVFFTSLPDGLFPSFNGIKADGEISYQLSFAVDFSWPDSLTFESSFNGKKLSIRSFGNINPYSLNAPFDHSVIEKGKLLRIIHVGPENKFFTPYSQLNPALINCVLTAEDGSFFGHSGFNEEAFRQSIVTNLKERRFARGGSTITMQLVKNLFLARNKNISRKMEEALWVWLIENKRIISKERMLEIYLNIIEWGPDVYGIGEASRYYFNKPPDKLTLNECIFLAGIIPNPKNFRFAFDKEGNLRNYFQSFFRIVAERLLLKGKISEEEFQSVIPAVKLNGPAAALVMPADSLPDFNINTIEEDDNLLP